jgi:hypothetical protein
VVSSDPRTEMRECEDANLLMSENIRPKISLFPLNDLDIRFHPLFREILSEKIADIRIRVQSSELFVSR